MRATLLVLVMLFSGVASAEEASKPADYTDVRGSIVFRTYCALCHGYKADGNGRAARNYSPRPANLTASTATDAYRTLIIRKGGAAVGRSEFMPPWGNELTEEQIADVVYYLNVIAVKKPELGTRR